MSALPSPSWKPPLRRFLVAKQPGAEAYCRDRIRKKMRLLDGIFAEVQELLKDRQFSPALSRLPRRVKPLRKVECVELMLSANNLSVGYLSTPEQDVASTV